MNENRTQFDDMKVADAAGLIAEPARATILTALLDGRALPAGELAMRAHITPQTASMHLGRLVEGRLLSVEKCGRHRYFRLAGSEVAQALEALSALSGPAISEGPKSSPQKEALSFARTCYDHLAGKLAVAIAQALVEREFLIPNGNAYDLTLAGERALRQWGIDVDEARMSDRAFARACLDWTERRHHLAGALGAALLRHMISQGWVARVNGSRRMILTDSGRDELRERLGMRISGDAIFGYEE